MVLDVDLNKTLYNGENFEIQDGDVISIFSILNNRQNVVHISGSITRPGFYELTDSLRLYDIILNADSLLGDAYLDRLDLIRTKPDFSKELIKLNLSKVIANDPSHNIFLQGMDNITIYSKLDIRLKKWCLFQATNQVVTELWII